MAMQTTASKTGAGAKGAGAGADVKARLHGLIDYIKNGRIIDAMHEFYAPHAKMQENGNAPTVGLEANVEREKQFLAQVKDWKGFTVTGAAAEGDRTFMETIIEFTNHQGQHVRMEQVSCARWENGKIVHERFYYDASGKK